MNPKAKITIRDFSLLTGISKDTLRFYDKIGLLTPDLRGENKYRYYTERQLELAFLISDLRALGIGLEEIKQYANERSPERMLSFFAEQDKRVAQEIEHLLSIQELMHLRSDTAIKALQAKLDQVVLEEKKREPIFLCPFPDEGKANAYAMAAAYDYAAAQGINISFPFGCATRQADLLKNTKDCPFRYYFKVRKKYNAWKCAGTYAVLYRRNNEDPAIDFYEPLLSFIQENNLKIAGDIYEEYPLDELTTYEWKDIMVRIEVCVIPKK